MHLIPRTGWWIAAWCSEDAESKISVDICTPPAMIDGEWTYIDLELDLLAFGNGHVEIDDEDEFAAACETGLIPRSEAIAARTAAREIERCLRERIEPFGRAGWDRLNEALGMALPPLTELRDVPTA
jgi:predicted RNA-binding protein associated with RNAse of E/G family